MPMSSPITWCVNRGCVGFVVIIILDRYAPTELAVYDPIFIFVFVCAGGLLGVILASVFSPFKDYYSGSRIWMPLPDAALKMHSSKRSLIPDIAPES